MNSNTGSIAIDWSGLTKTTGSIPRTICRSNPGIRGSAWSRAIQWLSVKPLSFEEEQKRLLFGFLVALTGAVLLAFGSYHLLAGEVVEGSVDVATAVLIFAAVATLRKQTDGTVVYRSVTVVFCLLFAYFGVLGEEHGNRVLWAFVFPPCALFFCGPALGRDAFGHPVAVVVCFLFRTGSMDRGSCLLGRIHIPVFGQLPDHLHDRYVCRICAVSLHAGAGPLSTPPGARYVGLGGG